MNSGNNGFGFPKLANFRGNNNNNENDLEIATIESKSETEMELEDEIWQEKEGKAIADRITGEITDELKEINRKYDFKNEQAGLLKRAGELGASVSFLGTACAVPSNNNDDNIDTTDNGNNNVGNNNNINNNNNNNRDP